MPSLVTVCTVLLLGWGVQVGAFPTWRPPVAKRAIIFGVDGVSLFTLQRARQLGKIPTIERLLRQSAWAESRAHQPSLSGPNWASVFFGAPPEVHGVRSGNWRRGSQDFPMYSAHRHASDFPTVGLPDAYDYCATWPSVFSAFKAAKPHGRTLAYYTWPFIGSLLSDFSVDDDQFFPGCSPKGHRQCPDTEQRLMDQFIARLRGADPPDLSAVVLGVVDEAGHAVCDGGEALDEAHNDMLTGLEFVDKWLGQLDQALRDGGMFDDTLLVFVSDHGRDESGCDHGGWSLAEHATLWAARHRSVRPGRVPVPVMVSDTAPTVLWAMDVDAPQVWHSVPVRSAFASAGPGLGPAGLIEGKNMKHGPHDRGVCESTGPRDIDGEYEGAALAASDRGGQLRVVRATVALHVTRTAREGAEDVRVATLTIRVVPCGPLACPAAAAPVVDFVCRGQRLARSTTARAAHLQLLTLPWAQDCHDALVRAGVRLNLLDRLELLARRAGRPPDLVPNAHPATGRLMTYDAEEDGDLIALPKAPAVTVRLDYLPHFEGVTVGLYRAGAAPRSRAAADAAATPPGAAGPTPRSGWWFNVGATALAALLLVLVGRALRQGPGADAAGAAPGGRSAPFQGPAAWSWSHGGDRKGDGDDAGGPVGHGTAPGPQGWSPPSPQSRSVAGAEWKAGAHRGGRSRAGMGWGRPGFTDGAGSGWA